MAFSSLGLSEALLRAIADHGHDAPTPIQSKAVPVVLAGRDVLATAQTGTGKTAAFSLPILHRLAEGRGTNGAPRALVITPTRELAAQVSGNIRAYGRHVSLRTESVVGGMGMVPQIKALRRGVDILVCTPGRLLDHVERRTVNLSKIEILVLDEADRMLDMGFIPDIRRIIGLLPAQRQNLLFSATFSPDVRKFAGSLLTEPEVIDVAPRNAPAELVAHHVHPVDREKKRDLLVHLVKTGDWQQTLVFSRTKHGADRLAAQLDRAGISSDAIHGDKSQGVRTRALAQFRQGRVRVLVATDIAARGIDIDKLPRVVNFDLPNVAEDYVHRIGRTGRAGTNGEALSLVSGDERQQLRSIERLLGKAIASTTVEGFAPSSNWAAKADAGNSRRPPRREHNAGKGEGHHRRRGGGSRPEGGRRQRG
jgi:ATP-dependent RNA helicase RhlE